ncbi:MAG: isoaspartyl peptidase [Oscillatoria sp. SIO1A7]|nr:isoaspartyl peptidase [Oscillatoria sp. SIO1A7]
MESQVQPKLIIHGGSGSSIESKGGLIAVRQSLHKIVEEVYEMLLRGAIASEAVVRGCTLLEDNPLFNAGTGSVLQSDGQIRMSASLMDGATNRFSGVINASRLKNPIELAKFLQNSPDRVLSDYGAAELLRELNVPPYNPLTDKRLEEWIEERKENFTKKMANTVAEPAGSGTIGVVALDNRGGLAVGTSTGGKGFERIGRTSDSAMPAGNYTNGLAAVSCTGIGEDIIDECLAARIVVRVSDGFDLKGAFEKSFAEADDRQRDFAAIGIDATGAIAWGKTCDLIVAAFHDGQRIGDSLEIGQGTKVFLA